MKRTGLSALLILGALSLGVPGQATGPAPAGAPAEATPSANQIREVQIQESDSEVRVVIRGSSTPSFTVFKLQNPMRVFIDIAGARLEGVRSPLRVNNGVIDEVVTMQLDDQRKAVGRVIVGFEQAAPYQVQAEGDALVVAIAAAPRRGLGPNAAQVRELHELEDQVRRRLAAEEEGLARRRSALQQELAVWQQREQQATSLAQQQKEQVEHLTTQLSQGSQKVALLERALHEADAELKALRGSRQQDEGARARMEAEARTRQAELATAAQAAQRELDERLKAAEAAMDDYNRQRAHLAELTSEVSSSQATLAAIQAERLSLQEKRQTEEARLATLRQAVREAESKRAQAERLAAEAQTRQAEAERLARLASEQRERAERDRSSQASEARAAEQKRRAELAEAVRRSEEQRQAAQEAAKAAESRQKEIVAARKKEEARMTEMRAAVAKEQQRLEQFLEASRKAARSAEEAQSRLAALQQAEQAGRSRAAQASQTAEREESRAKAASEQRVQEERLAEQAAERRQQEEARARAAAETRKREEALLKASAEATRRQTELEDARRARLARSTEATRRKEAGAQAALAAAQANVARLEAEVGKKRTEANELAQRVEELRRQESELRGRLTAANTPTPAANPATEQELAEAERAMQDLRAQARESLEKAAAAQRELAEVRALANQRERSEASMRADLEQTRRSLEQAQASASEAQAQLERSRKDLTEREARASRLEEELRRSRSEGAPSAQRSAALAAQLEALRAETASLRAEAERAGAAEREAAGLRAEMARLREDAQRRVAAAEEAARLRAEAQAASRQAQATRSGRRSATQDETAERARRAAAAAARVATGAAPKGAAEAATGPFLSVKDLRFEDGVDRSRVIIEHDGRADYMIQEGEDGSAILHLDRARLPRVLARTLDTSALPSPVRSVSSFAGDPKRGDVRVVVALETPSESHLRREPNRLVWEFLKPGTAPEGGTVLGQRAEEREPLDGSEDFRIATTRVAGFRASGPSAGASGGDAGGAAESPRLGGGARKRFVGKRLTLDLREADIHNVLRLLAKEGRINIIASEDVKGTLTLHLERIPWDQALDVILKTKGLTQTREGDIIWITPIDQLRQQQKMQMEVKKARTELEPLEVRLVTVNYADPSQLVTQAKTLLSERGAVAVDTRTKTMIIKDVPDHAEAVEDLMRRLDTQTPLVLIEGRIVEVSTSYVKDVGIQWGGDFTMSPETANPTGLRFPSTVGVRGGADDAQVSVAGVEQIPNFVVNLPAAAGGGSGGALGLTFGSLGGSANLSVRLTALEEQGVLKIISSPKVTTMDNSAASISQGVSIPISVVSAQGVNTVFFDANLELKVTPHVTQDGHVVLEIFISKNTPDFSRTGARGDPSILRKQTTTTMMIKDGDTTVIGGIYTRENSRNVKKVPFFGDIPVLGGLFSFEGSQEKRSELLIFITPRIVNRAEAVVRGGKAGAGATFK